MNDDRYARVYYDRIAKDPKFDGIRNNRALMGSWMLLLVEAEKAWPSPAFRLPTSWVPARDFRVFVERELIDATEDGRYYMHGLDAVRSERSQRAADAAAARWGNASRNASGIADASEPRMPSKAKQSKDETSQAEGRAHDPAEDYLTLTGKWPTDKVITWIDELTGQYGAEAVSRHLATRHQEDRGARTLMGRASDSLKREARQLDRKEREAELARVAANRRSGPSPSVILARHNSGQHVDAPDPSCASCSGRAA